MKIIVNRLGRRLIHGRRLLQLLKLCLGDIFNGFKGFQQRLRPARPYARDRRQAGGQSRSFPGLPVVADGEPVDLILNLAHQVNAWRLLLIAISPPSLAMALVRCLSSFTMPNRGI